MIGYREGYKYQLAQEYKVSTSILPDEDIVHDFFALSIDGTLTVKKGYAWDGASGPTFDTKSSMRPSLVHDCFCQMMREELLSYNRWQNRVNRLFYTHCLEDGMWAWRAKLWYAAVEFANAGRPDGTEGNPIVYAP